MNSIPSDELSPTLTHLTGKEFNQLVDKLPLTVLTTENAPGQPFSQGEIEIDVANHFCQILPPTLVHLDISLWQPIQMLLVALTHLTTGKKSTNQSISFLQHSLTSQLEEISINQWTLFQPIS
jgi:hypothetical protein